MCDGAHTEPQQSWRVRQAWAIWGDPMSKSVAQNKDPELNPSTKSGREGGER